MKPVFVMKNRSQWYIKRDIVHLHWLSIQLHISSAKHRLETIKFSSNMALEILLRELESAEILPFEMILLPDVMHGMWGSTV